jgi:hypothetical protein
MTESERPTLATRFAKVRAQSTLLTAAILAAHGAAEGNAGFRPTDVRFFFLLFANWVERDLETPGHDLDLTQVRRALDQLVAGGAAILAAPATGLSALQRRRVAQLCDLKRIVREAIRRVRERISDLDERIRSSLALSEHAARLRARGARDDEIARRLEAERAYRLHHVRPFSAVIGSLPAPQRAFELGPAMELRARLLFEPLAAAARAELGVWARVLEGIEQIPVQR